MRGKLQIRPARAEDWPALRQLLQACGLTEVGVAAQLDRVRVATWQGQIVGMALLERYAEGGLLRSVAVDPAWQGRGIGRRLVEAMLETAQKEGLRQVFLLTETAADFFAGWDSSRSLAQTSRLRSDRHLSSPICVRPVAGRCAACWVEF